MNQKHRIMLIALAALFLPAELVADVALPKLVLQVTVDQLRGDQPVRYASHFGEGGFRYLMENGIHYRNAHYLHANTETIVGHASLATGTVPAAHGMVANVWYDRELGRLVYNIEDERYSLLTVGADVDDSTEIDPTQRVATGDGRSPAAILSSTVTDEMAIHFGGRSKLFGVSVKDRGAVAMAGHAGKAFWFSKATGQFVSSDYYFEEYPKWVVQWNRAELPSRYGGQAWELTLDRSEYLFGDRDDRPYETNFPGFGRTFPHAWGAADDKYFTTRLTLSPAGDQLTLDFAKTLIEKEQLGQDEVPDYLSISFSATDYIGHVFGPSSLEAEDNMLKLDRTLADLFAFVDKTVGLEHTLIVLSADHGGPETPGFLNELGMRNAHYFKPEEMDRDPAIQRLKNEFGIGSELITMYSHPYVYLDRKVIADLGLDQAEVEDAVATELMGFQGIALAVSSSALTSNRLPDTLLMRAVLRNFHRKRSGDIFVVFEPNVFINDMDGLSVASTHGSPWRYDTYVPIFFAGFGVDHGVVHRPVTPYDIASTLTAVLGSKPTSGAIGQPLSEVVDR